MVDVRQAIERVIRKIGRSNLITRTGAFVAIECRVLRELVIGECHMFIGDGVAELPCWMISVTQPSISNVKSVLKSLVVPILAFNCVRSLAVLND